MPRRVRRQRQILAALSERYAALTPRARFRSRRTRPMASFGFSMRTPPEEAMTKLVAYLDEVDPEWRSFVKVWDGPLSA